MLLSMLLLSSALTQDGEEFSDVVVVYANEEDVPNADNTDTYTFDTEFWQFIQPGWAIPDFFKGLTPDWSTGDGGQVPEPNCDALLIHLFDLFEIARGTNQFAEYFLNDNNGQPALFYSDGSPANRKARGIRLAGEVSKTKGEIANIRSQMEALNCFKQ